MQGRRRRRDEIPQQQRARGEDGRKLEAVPPRPPGEDDVLISNAGTAAPRVGAAELTAEAAMEGFAITSSARYG